MRGDDGAEVNIATLSAARGGHSGYSCLASAGQVGKVVGDDLEIGRGLSKMVLKL